MISREACRWWRWGATRRSMRSVWRVSEGGPMSSKGFKPLARMLDRVETSRDESDTVLFGDLMLLGELAFKLAILGIVACLQDSKDRARYSAEYRLARADSIGKWTDVLDDVVVGVQSQSFSSEALADRRQFTARVGEDAWQSQAIVALQNCINAIDRGTDAVPPKVDLRRWFALFVILRNKSRGHGALTPSNCST